MILGIPKEILDGEQRVAALPEMVAEYIKMGFDVRVQSSAGEGAFCSDADYAKAGAKIVGEAAILTEGERAKWRDIISLGHLPVFTD